jgi:hypothetical protein
MAANGAQTLFAKSTYTKKREDRLRATGRQFSEPSQLDAAAPNSLRLSGHKRNCFELTKYYPNINSLSARAEDSSTARCKSNSNDGLG